MKKIFAIGFLAVALQFSLYVTCGAQEINANMKKINPTKTEGVKRLSAPKTIGLMWVGKSGMADAVARGFLTRLEQIAPEVKVDVKMNLADMQEGERVFYAFEKQQDGIVFLRSTGARFLGKYSPSVPSFFGACNNPVALGALKNMEAPEGNVTGVTYYLPYARTLDAFQSLFPRAKSVLLLLEKGHPSTAVEQQETRTACEKRGLQYQEAVCATKQELVLAVRKMRDKADLMIIGNQALIIDNARMIVTVAKETPVASYAKHAVELAALAGLVPDDFKLGKMLADSVFDVVVKGKKIKAVPVKTDPSPDLLINAKTMAKLKIEFPQEIMKTATIIK